MYNPFSLSGKSILVTGASSGIGKATAIECAKLGANVFILGRNTERLIEVFNALQNDGTQTHQYLVGDINEDIDSIISKLPILDGVSDNAGTTNGNKPIKFLKETEILDVFKTNTLSHVVLAKMLMKKKKLNNNASYVFTASIGGNFSTVTGQATYGISKAGINAFMKYCAIEFASKGIRCNSICPGMILTPLIQYDTMTDEEREQDAEKYLLKRYGQPEEVAKPICFLLSEAASYITGTTLIIDGGYSVNH